MAAFGWEGQARAALEEACRGAGVSLVADNLREHAADLHTALTLVDWGIAATGSLGLDSSSEDLRAGHHVGGNPRGGLTLIPPPAGFRSFGRGPDPIDGFAPSYVASLPGPPVPPTSNGSSTIGVHGPQELHVLILKDQAS